MAATPLLPDNRSVGGMPAELRPLSGEDQCFLAAECGRLPPAQWATEALARCVTHLGGKNAVTREALRALTVGEREALLLRLRRRTWGDRLRCLLVCPVPECGEKLEIDLDIADLLLPGREQVGGEYEEVFGEEPNRTMIRFRLPTGSDQEAAALMAQTDLNGAVGLILGRCIHAAYTIDGKSVAPLPEALAEQLVERMAELDPQAEIGLQLSCPVCGGVFRTIFDTAGYLMQELRTGLGSLYREVHLLAYHYHWSATEILAMSTGRRRTFLRLLRDELAEESPS